MLDSIKKAVRKKWIRKGAAHSKTNNEMELNRPVIALSTGKKYISGPDRL